KTTIGKLFSTETGWPFYDGDDFQPPENVAKMSAGIPLADADRLPWLRKMRRHICGKIRKGKDAIYASSALKEAYRKILSPANEEIIFVYLKGSYDLILHRLQTRQGHFMKPEMLKSQFAALEEPRNVLTVNIDASPERITRIIREKLRM